VHDKAATIPAYVPSQSVVSYTHEPVAVLKLIWYAVIADEWEFGAVQSTTTEV
jgi:hypothetical protein